MKKVVGALINVVGLYAMRRALHWVHILFSTPRKGKLNTNNLAPFLQVAHLDFFLYKNEKVYTYQWNETQSDLPLVLLIHGWESNSARWQALCEYLGDAFRYVAVDAPSLGMSYGKNLSVKNYQEVIDLALVKFKPHFVIGHSLGAFALFQQLSEVNYLWLKKAVIMGTFDRFEVILSHYYEQMGYSKRVREAYHKYIEDIINKPLVAYCCTHALQSVDVPVLYIHDKEDPQVFYQETKSFQRALLDKNNTVIATDHLGHSLQHETVFHTIQTFLS